MSWYRSLLFCLCVSAQCMHRLACLCMHVRRPEVNVGNFPLECSTPFWGRTFTEPRAPRLTQLAGRQGRGPACLPPQCWDYRCSRLYWAPMWLLEIEQFGTTAGALSTEPPAWPSHMMCAHEKSHRSRWEIGIRVWDWGHYCDLYPWLNLPCVLTPILHL